MTNEELFSISSGVLTKYTGAEKSVSVPVGVRKIAREAFCNNKLIRSVALPSTVTEICRDAFNNCICLDTINLPDSITRLGKSCFMSCASLREIRLPPLLKTVPDDAFAFCRSLERVVFPDKLQRIGSFAFAFCSSLCELELPEGLEFIDDEVFFECDRLPESVVLPASIRKIGKSVFLHTPVKNVVTMTSACQIRAVAFDKTAALIAPELPTARLSRLLSLNLISGYFLSHARGSGSIYSNREADYEELIKVHYAYLIRQLCLEEPQRDVVLCMLRFFIKRKMLLADDAEALALCSYIRTDAELMGMLMDYRARVFGARELPEL